MRLGDEKKKRKTERAVGHTFGGIWSAREEARDHALLYADGGVSVDQIRVLVVSDPAEPDRGE